jgi:ADP-heptose:LPS heptosyltransferase
MIAKTIKYSQRLGDIVRCLPACKYLADQGHEVFFDCFAQYQEVFEMTSYVKAGHRQGDILDLEIWPNKYQEYRASGKTWTDFVYSHSDIKGADPTNIIFDKLDDEPAKGLPKEYNMVAPFGISQGHKRDPLQIIVEARKKCGDENFFVLCPSGVEMNGISTYTAPSIIELVRAIRGANEFWSIDSGQMAIAAGVRKDKKVVYFPQTIAPFDKDNIFIWDTVEIN